jgi:hypothetical protein
MTGSPNIPSPNVPVLRQDGGMDQRWYEPLKKGFTDLLRLTKSFGDSQGNLGTAAFKNIGTSGDSVPLLNTANTFSKAQTFDVVELEDAASIAWDWSLGPIAKVTLGDNRALAAPTGTNGKAGTWSLFIRQDDVGSRLLTLDPVYLPPGGEAIELSTDPNALDILTCITDGTSIAVSLSHNHAAP